MKIDAFIHENSLHDSYIIRTEYTPHKRMLILGLVQLFSEISINNETKIAIEPTDQVELEIVLSGVEYVCNDILNLEDFEIYSINNGMIGQYEVIMIQFINEGLYKELYIRGNNINLQAKILGKYSYDC